MSELSTATLPALAVCEQARLSRDARFDGLFFTAVTSTRIYCRPVCPAPPPKPANIRYYASAAAAEAAGFRPCLRCRPELAPGNASWHRGEHVVARALKLIEAGALSERPLAELATAWAWARGSCAACSWRISARRRSTCTPRAGCCSPSSC